ncbi:Vesicle tethering protein p115-like protein [Niveomyces insectorum RCEF 264]|uniref:Vesicle tethering protein p115-like protein n=1 Tax=Niveomyces insectorum RCEF 264 TaxID=1081102 RepID=A0A167SJ63_9HYPO|nr:Vesicle tethering protein p115-like protein [Niveomyces insectorum RCEF 264]
MFSIATAPAKQSVGETISVLSGRLSSATLLEDRRAAILGLRSFAKEYPASVASGALRSLIGSLSKDGEDVDTVKVVLETLLMLFNPNENSPEASEEIALWLADEFTQRLENTTLLLDFLETNDFYSRLYALQLLSAILAARTDRTEECIFTAPLGISRLVAILDDKRDVIRNEAISLLTYLTPTSTEIQKLVAFESAFERIFKIVAEEGSVSDGGRVIEDCLILLANLLRLNAHNQTLFRESLCTAQLARLLQDASAPGRQDEEMAGWALAQRNRNIYALLAVIRLFFVPGAASTVQNQAEFWRHGVLYHALQLSFSHVFEIPIRAEALTTCAAIIRGNPTLQENFAQLRVPSPLETHPAANGTGTETEKPAANGVHGEVYVIDGLLDLTLSVFDPQFFDVRMAACECLKAYFFNHEVVRLHFLQRAIDGHTSGADETANVLTTLLRSPTTAPSSDPYRHWFAAVLMFHLVYENPKAKALVMAVTEGDEANGEEVVTSIQTIAAHLLGSMHRGDDERVVIGYLMLLLCWLFESLEGVNDFLGEGSNVQGLVQAVVKNTSSEVVVQGLCALLLGVLYEFSTKDSPIPRQKLHEILMSRMGRDRYINKLNTLRTCPALRDFEVIPQKLDPLAGQKLPDVFFDGAFVDFFKDNYSRLMRAIDRDPGMEISFVTNGVQQGISRELVDALRAELGDKDRVLREAQERISTLENALGQERADHRRTKDTATSDLAKAKTAHESLAQKHTEELRQLGAEHEKNRSDLRRKIEQVQKTAEADAARMQRRLEAELADLRATNSRLEVDLLKANKSKAQELQAAQDKFKAQLADAKAEMADATKTIRDVEGKLAAADIQAAELREALEASEEDGRKLRERVQTFEKDAKKTTDLLKKSQEEKKTTQSELDDLLMVFSDLEEKVTNYKARLKELGEQISDDEGGDEEDDDDGDDDGEVD